MPRRPRPASRGGNPKAKNGASSSKTMLQHTKPASGAKHMPSSKGKLKRPAQPADSDEDSDEDVDEEIDEDIDDGSDGSDEEEDRAAGSSRQARADIGMDEDDDDDEDDENDDADAPRVALWEPDDDGQYLNDNGEDEEDEKDEDAEEQRKERAIPAEKTLKNTLQDLPLGALRQAQRMLAQAEPDSDSGSDSEGDVGSGSDEDGAPAVEDLKGKRREKVERVEWSAKPRKDIGKRSSKHAPTEVTSKRPVTRKRQAIEVPKIVPRDPRFLPTAGEFDASRFTKSYAFLADSHQNELATLRSTLAHARKLLASSPRDLRTAREAEVHRLEQAVKRAESLVNRDRLDAVEREALSKVKKAEMEGRASGKGEWHLKRGEKQKLVVQARYEALARDGGQRAVKKAIEKKQKKVSQKEKRSRPYAKGEFSGGGGAGGGGSGERPFKRRRV